MSVYVNKLPDSCYDCCCNNDDWNCRLTDSDLPNKWGVRNGDCPLKVLVHCKDCKWCKRLHSKYHSAQYVCEAHEDTEMGFAIDPNGYCSYGERKGSANGE